MGLGSLRFMLSLLVLDAHFAGFRTYLQPWVVNTFGIDRVAYLGEGGIAVTGFFVVSGYLIAYVLDRKYDAIAWRGIGRFYMSRIWRIYPLYFLIFTVFWSIQSWSGPVPHWGLKQLLANLLLLPYGIATLFSDHNRFSALDLSASLFILPAWTLTVDLWLYLFAPFLFTRKLTSWTVWFLGLAYFLSFIFFADPRPPIWYGYFYASAMPYIFAFASGTLIYLHGFSPGRWLFAIAAVGLIYITFFPLGMTNTALNHLLTALFFSVVVAGVHSTGKTRQDRFLGDLTYATYLIHVPLLQFFERAGYQHPVLWAMFFTYLFSVLLVYGFEYPMERWRNHRLAPAGQKTTHRARRISMGEDVGRNGNPTMVESIKKRVLSVRSWNAHNALSALLLAVVASGAVFSLWNNLYSAGSRIRLQAAECPLNWDCRDAKIHIQGEGQTALFPRLPLRRRQVFDIKLEGGQGEIFAGLAGRNGLRVGLRRQGEHCRLEIRGEQLHQDNPVGWRDSCLKTHRIVLDPSKGQMLIAIDSMWIYGAPLSGKALRNESGSTSNQEGAFDLIQAIVQAHPDSDGSVVFREVFVGGVSP